MLIPLIPFHSNDRFSRLLQLLLFCDNNLVVTSMLVTTIFVTKIKDLTTLKFYFDKQNYH